MSELDQAGVEVAQSSAVQSKRAGRTRRSGSGHHLNRLWIFLVPAAILYVFVVVWPSIQGAGFAFTDWDGLTQVKNFIGLDNFIRIWQDPDSKSAVWHTLLIAVAITIFQNGLGLLLALGVNTQIKSRNFLRVVLFAPAVITPVAVGFLWQNLLAPDGAVNQLLEVIGLSSWKQDWLGDSDIAIWCIVGVIVWQFTGYSMVIFLAGLQSVPTDVIEASHLDGTGPFSRFWYVVRPFLAPAITINLMLSVIGGLKLFDQVWVMTQGGPGGATETISTLIYKSAFQFNDFAYGIALAVVLTIFVAAISGVQYRILDKQEEKN